MSASDLVADVRELLDVDVEAFKRAAREEAIDLKREVRNGTFDNTQAIVGLELELYAVDDRTGGLRRVPRSLLGLIGFEKELGLHNAEMQTSPQPLNPHGLAVQQRELVANLEPALARTAREDIRLVSDGMWTVPPRAETAREYLCDSVEEDGIRLATNMSAAVRYHAMTNTKYQAGQTIDAPHVSLSSETVLPESLITSIQPHYQIPHAPDLPEYFTYALRVAGPLLALGVNSPFFPPSLYDDDDDEEIVADAWMEHRITVFEDVLNVPDDDVTDKVRFPRDVDTVDDAIDAIIDDPLIVPDTVETGGRFDDAFVHFRQKRGSFWRWVRPVFDGATRSAANARIEFRPVAAQPTVADAVSFQAVFAGLMESLPQFEHPVRSLDWEQARENFYAACREGLAADMVWLTPDGSETTDPETIYDDLFAHAREGLEQRGLSSDEVDRYVRPLEMRATHGMTPARWKHNRVARAVAENTPLAEAIWGMQADYVEKQTGTLLEGTFLDWL